MGLGFNIKSLALLTFFSVATSNSDAQTQVDNAEDSAEMTINNQEGTAEERVAAASENFKCLGLIVNVGTKDLKRGKTLEDMAEKERATLDRFYVKSNVEAVASDQEKTSVTFVINGEELPPSAPNSRAFYSAVSEYLKQQHSHGVTNQQGKPWENGEDLEGVTAVIHLIDDGRSETDIQSFMEFIKDGAEQDGMPIDNIVVDFDSSSEAKEHHFSLFNGKDVVIGKNGEAVLYTSCKQFDKGLSHLYKSEDLTAKLGL